MIEKKCPEASSFVHLDVMSPTNNIDYFKGQKNAERRRKRKILLVKRLTDSPLARPHEMPLLDFVLKGGVRNSVKAASTMHAHFAALNRAYRLDEAVPVVIPVFAALRSGALAAGARLRLIRVLRLLLRLLLLLRRRLLLLLLRWLRRCITTSLERTRVCHHGLLRRNHSGRLAARHTGRAGCLALLELDADALGDDVAEINGHRFAHQRIRGTTGAGERWTSSLQETRTRGRSREALGERGGSRLAVLAGTARRAGGLVGRNLQYRSTLSAIAGFFLDVGIEVVIRHGPALLLRLLMRGEGMVLMVMRLRLVSVHVLVQPLVLAHQLPHHFRYAIVSHSIHAYVIIIMSIVESHAYLSV